MSILLLRKKEVLGINIKVSSTKIKSKDRLGVLYIWISVEYHNMPGILAIFLRFLKFWNCKLDVLFFFGKFWSFYCPINSVFPKCPSSKREIQKQNTNTQFSIFSCLLLAFSHRKKEETGKIPVWLRQGALYKYLGYACAYI